MDRNPWIRLHIAVATALIVGLYWPWAELTGFAIRNFTEGFALWLMLTCSPLIMIEVWNWLCRKLRGLKDMLWPDRRLIRRAKALAR